MRPAESKLWQSEGVASKAPAFPGKEEGDESVHKAAVPKRQAGTAVASRRARHDTQTAFCACHSKVVASMAQQANLCRFCVFPWSHECIGFQKHASPTN